MPSWTTTTACPRPARLRALEQRDDRADAALDAAVEVVVLELRRHLVADDAARHGVGQRAFEPVADLDAHLAVLRRDDDEHAVVLALLAELPLVEDARRRIPRSLSLPIVGTVSTTIWFVVLSSCCLERLAVSRSRAAGERISASSTTRPERKGTSAASAGSAREQRAQHGGSLLISCPASSIGRSANASAVAAHERPCSPAGRSMRVEPGEHRIARRAGAQLLRHRRDHRVPFRRRDRVARSRCRRGSRRAARACATSTRIAVRVRGGEELPVEKLHLRVLRDSRARRASRAGRVARTPGVDGSRARTARRRRGLRRSTSATAALVTQSGRTRSPTTTTSAASDAPSAKAFHTISG